MSDPLLISGIHENYDIEINAEGLDKARGPAAVPLAPPEVWGSHVKSEFTFIQASKSGRLLLDGIKRDGNGRWVRIIPDHFFKNTSSTLYDHYCHADTHDVTRVVGGRSYAVELRFSPDRFFKGSYCQQSQYRDETSDRGAAPHEVLFHELVHAYRYVSGKHPAHAALARGGLRFYDNAEEFFAILITNIFISDPSTPITTGLRRDHWGHAALDENLASSFGFFSCGAQAFTFIDRLCKDHRKLTSGLAEIKATFNPLRAYYCDPERARKLSQNNTAKTRDLIGKLPDTVLGDAARDLAAPLRILLNTASFSP